MKTITITKGSPEDAVKILRLIKKNRETYSGGPGLVDSDAIMWIAKIICNGIVLNASLGGRLVGSIGLSLTQIPWNMKEKYLRSEWACVADPIIIGVREQLIIKSAEIAARRDLSLMLDLPAHMESDIEREGTSRFSGCYWVKKDVG